jgi:hypothetical protein
VKEVKLFESERDGLKGGLELSLKAFELSGVLALGQGHMGHELAFASPFGVIALWEHCHHPVEQLIQGTFRHRHT